MKTTNLPDIVYPWTVIVQEARATEQQWESIDKWQWAIGFIRQKNFPRYVWERPIDGKTVDQVTCLTQWAMGSRNWIVCFSKSANYMRTLFNYIATSWVCTTSKRAEVADVLDLHTAAKDIDGEKWDTLQYADLLIVPYFEGKDFMLNRYKGILATLFQRRKQRMLATILDIYVPQLQYSDSKYPRYATEIKNTLGNIVYGLFSDVRSTKYVGVSIPNER